MTVYDEMKLGQKWWFKISGTSTIPASVTD